jgi:hypothetical protein
MTDSLGTGQHTSVREYEGTEEMYRWTIATRERVLGMEHPSTPTSVNNLGSATSDLAQ